MVIRIRPGPIEYELAPGIGFLIQRHRAYKLMLVIVQCHVAGVPTRAGAGALRGFHCSKKLVTQEWAVCALQSIPGCGIDVVDGVYYLGAHWDGE